MKYRRLVVAGLAAMALTITAAGCGDSSSPSDNPTTTEHDMNQMQPGETMPTTAHDMNQMQPGETMPTTEHDMNQMQPGETMAP